jgi:hypothetical protein
MPLPGGAAAKFGDRYETRWTIVQLADVLAERVQTVRLEPPGAEGEGVEFWVSQKGGRSYHQVKRQAPRGRVWSIDALGRAGVVAHLLRKLEDPLASCVFVSADSAGELRELAERAKSATDWGEFSQEFLKSDQAKTTFDKVRTYVDDLSDEETYQRLKRIEMRTIDEMTLQRLLESHLLLLVEGEPSTVAAVLAQFAADNVHSEIEPSDLWRHLEAHGFRPRDWAKNQVVVQAVGSANARYLERLRSDLINHQPLPREEVDAVLAALDAEGASFGVVVAGDAGVGKSGVVLQVLDQLVRQRIATLAFRVDALEPVSLPRDVGKQLNLPDSPAAVLAALAQGQPSVLVIDQLDAVSMASGRNPIFFECIEEMIRQARSYSGMKVIVACRQFDLENDRRFRSLTNTGTGIVAVSVGALSRDTVNGVLRDLGLDPGRVNEKQRDLLTIPLHLALLAEIASDRSIDPADFETSNDLYKKFWELKQKLVELRLDRVVAWTHVIDALCQYMSVRQVLSAPVVILDEYRLDAAAMASERFIVRYGERYSFFHEGFFDYCFARRFTARGESLLSLLRSGEQHLFRRAQVRQILLHERDNDRARYLAELRELLTAADVRKHIKDVVQALLGAMKDPTREEWEILEGLTSSAGVAGAGVVWRVVHGSIPWFRFLKSLGVLQRWLSAGDEVLADRTMLFLASVQRQAADDVADVLEPYVGGTEPWRRRLLYIAQWTEPGAGERFLEFFVRLIDAGILDAARGPIASNSEFWSVIYGLPERQPGWAAKVIGHYFARRLEIARSAGQKNPLEMERSQLADQIFVKTAKGAPMAFVDEVLPVMLQVMEMTLVRVGVPPWRDEVWRYREVGGGSGVDGALMTAMETALSEIARDNPMRFREIIRPLKGSEFESVQYLLIRGYSASGSEFADDAADYILERPARLESGYLSNAHWATRELLTVITPHCSEGRLRQLEEAILGYYTPWERSPAGYKFQGLAQFGLLGGTDPERRSERARRRYQELERKFGEQEPKPPRRVGWQSVGSPVSEAAGGQMTDDQWLSAILKYAGDA